VIAEADLRGTCGIAGWNAEASTIETKVCRDVNERRFRGRVSRLQERRHEQQAAKDTGPVGLLRSEHGVPKAPN